MVAFLREWTCTASWAPGSASAFTSHPSPPTDPSLNPPLGAHLPSCLSLPFVLQTESFFFFFCFACAFLSPSHLLSLSHTTIKLISDVVQLFFRHQNNFNSSFPSYLNKLLSIPTSPASNHGQVVKFCNPRGHCRLSLFHGPVCSIQGQ